MKKYHLGTLSFLALILLIPSSQTATAKNPRISLPVLTDLDAQQLPGRLPAIPPGFESATRSNLRAETNFGRLPLRFIANQGQIDERVSYYVKGRDKSAYFGPDGVTFVLNDPAETRSPLSRLGLDDSRPLAHPEIRTWAVRLGFIGAGRDVKPVGLDKTDGQVSYFKGRPEDWHTGIPTYSKIVYPGLWPGIDLVYSGTFDRLKYEFIVHPGADPGQVRLAYQGAGSVAIDGQGHLRVDTPAGSFYDDVPVAYQEIDGQRTTVSLAYKPEAEARRETQDRLFAYGFEVGDYDKALPLVLDPAIIIYCGYLGGSADDGGYALSVDGSGNVYIVGDTMSTETSFPETVGPDVLHNGGYDAFVAKINSTGTALIYCGYIGGAGMISATASPWTAPGTPMSLEPRPPTKPAFPSRWART